MSKKIIEIFIKINKNINIYSVINKRDNMKCPKCGLDNEDDSVFCKKCGNKLTTENTGDKNKKILILSTIIICIIILAAALIIVNNNNSVSNTGTKLGTQLTIHPKNSVDGEYDAIVSGDQLQIQIKDTKNWKPVSGAKIYITIENWNTGENKTFEATTNDKGLAYINVESESGEYTVHGVFKGDENYYGDTTNPDLIIVDHYEQIVQSNEPLRDGVDYDSSSLTPEQYEEVMNNPGGHYDLAGNYYAPGEGQ